MPTKHKHYQAIRSFADGWKIQTFNPNSGWFDQSHPLFYEEMEYRIAPDKDGWLPFYAHEESECPVDKNLLVEGEYPDGEVVVGGAGKFDWTDRDSIIRYRLVEKKPDCFNKGTEGGGECYHPKCKFHSKDEPICDG